MTRGGRCCGWPPHNPTREPRIRCVSPMLPVPTWPASPSGLDAVLSAVRVGGVSIRMPCSAFLSLGVMESSRWYSPELRHGEGGPGGPGQGGACCYCSAHPIILSMCDRRRLDREEWKTVRFLFLIVPRAGKLRYKHNFKDAFSKRARMEQSWWRRERVSAFQTTSFNSLLQPNCFLEC